MAKANLVQHHPGTERDSHPMGSRKGCCSTPVFDQAIERLAIGQITGTDTTINAQEAAALIDVLCPKGHRT